MTNYGPIDVVFFDGPPEQLKELGYTTMCIGLYKQMLVRFIQAFGGLANKLTDEEEHERLKEYGNIVLYVHMTSIWNCYLNGLIAAFFEDSDPKD